MQNYKHFNPIKGHLKVVLELLLKFLGGDSLSFEELRDHFEDFIWHLLSFNGF